MVQAAQGLGYLNAKVQLGPGPALLQMPDHLLGLLSQPFIVSFSKFG